jgi:NADH-quinone oxidoreductase subunit J
MTTRPRLKLGSHLVPGLVALALFVVLAAVFLTASFENAQGFGGAPITASIGYAMFDLAGGEVPSDGFLIAFEIIDLVLIAALAAAVMLARRESDGKLVGVESIRTDGGRSADSAADYAGSADDADADADTDTGVSSKEGAISTDEKVGEAN